MILLYHRLTINRIMNVLPITNLHQTFAPLEWQLADSGAATLAAQTAPRWLQARMSLLQAQPASIQGDETATPAPKTRPARAWWQSSWFWPWVLPTAQGSDAR